MRRAVQARITAERATADPRRELKEYLACALDMGCTSILLWWMVRLTVATFIIT